MRRNRWTIERVILILIGVGLGLFGLGPNPHGFGGPLVGLEAFVLPIVAPFVGLTVTPFLIADGLFGLAAILWVIERLKDAGRGPLVRAASFVDVIVERRWPPADPSAPRLPEPKR
jgi:hypothetical protein